MEKLTLEHIAPYLPYGLKALKMAAEKPYLVNITGGTKEDNSKEYLFYSEPKNKEVGNYETIYFKPILRPTDLTKPITIEGKEVIPIVELAKISFGKIGTYELNSNTNELITKINSLMDLKYKALSYRQGSFTHSNYNSKLEITHYFSAKNQLGLFKWLYANKFDLEGLIDAGLVIDVNTLETNPYE